MDLSDALGDGPGGAWPGGQPNNSTWPGQPANPAWPGGQPANPMWPGGQPANPTWPGGPTQPAGPGGWPSGPGPQPAGPGGWPSGPSPQPSAPGPWPAGPGPAVAPQLNLSVPFAYDFSSGIHDKMLITIAGIIKPNPNKFIVDFYASADLVFHFNPRFNEGGRQVIVRNSELGKKWGQEERDLPRFPFVPGQPFEMKILVTNASFKVAVNNSHLLEFKHRHSNLRAVTRMCIYHDVTLSNVNVETVP